MRTSSNLGVSFINLFISQGLHLSARAGTGLLSIVLSSLVRQYTVTDIPDLLPLIRKNLALNFDGWPNSNWSRSNITAEELDWLELHRTLISIRSQLVPAPADPINLLLAVLYLQSITFTGSRGNNQLPHHSKQDRSVSRDGVNAGGCCQGVLGALDRERRVGN